MIIGVIVNGNATVNVVVIKLLKLVISLMAKLKVVDVYGIQMANKIRIGMAARSKLNVQTQVAIRRSLNIHRK